MPRRYSRPRHPRTAQHAHRDTRPACREDGRAITHTAPPCTLVISHRSEDSSNQSIFGNHEKPLKFDKNQRCRSSNKKLTFLNQKSENVGIIHTIPSVSHPILGPNGDELELLRPPQWARPGFPDRPVHTDIRLGGWCSTSCVWTMNATPRGLVGAKAPPRPLGVATTK